jgi:hypothetical protein
LTEALRGQQLLLITISVKALSTVKTLIHAAADAGVAYILPNWLGRDANNKELIQDSLMIDLFENVKEIERLDVSSYFLLVCNFRYEFSLGGGQDRFDFDFKDRSVVMYDGGNVAINTSTWPQCGRAIAGLLSLKQLPEHENDKSPTLSQFRNTCAYIASFRVSQCDMLESVKCVTKTTDADWTISHASNGERYKEGLAAATRGDHRGWMKMRYCRMFFDNGDGDYETSCGVHNDMLGLKKEDIIPILRSVFAWAWKARSGRGNFLLHPDYCHTTQNRSTPVSSQCNMFCRSW